MPGSTTLNGDGGPPARRFGEGDARTDRTQAADGREGGGEIRQVEGRATVEFMRHLLGQPVAIWVAEPGGKEFVRPNYWPKLTPDGNDERLGRFKHGMALCANMGGVVAVVDVDPRNGGDTEKVRSVLAQLKVRTPRSKQRLSNLPRFEGGGDDAA